MNETTTFRWSFEEDVEHYAAARIPAIGVWRQKLSDYDPPKAAELLRRRGLKVSHLFWAGGFTGSDGHTYREGLDDAREALRAAALLEAQNLIVYSGARAGHTFNHARRLIKDALSELAPLAEESGVCLALEPMHPGCAGPWTFLTTVDDVLAVIAAVGSPMVKMVFDTYHVGHDPAIVGRLGELVPHIALVQLGDARQAPQGEQSRCCLGEGTVPLAEIVGGLKSAGYNGYYDVELLGEEIETHAYHDLLRHAQEVFARLISDGP